MRALRIAAAVSQRSPVSVLLEAPGWTLGAICLALHLAFNGGYGVFRDELYFIVCGLHPDFGYVDQPPLVPLIAGASYRLFGLALLPLRLLPALAMAATVALTTVAAGRLGGDLFARWLAGAATLLAPVLLVNGLLLSTDMIQPLTWLGCALCLLRLIETRDERWWLAFGAIVGVSLQSKYLIPFYVTGLMAGVLATPLRRSLARPWIYAGGALALAIAAPSLIWQAAHGWPFLELGRAAAAGKNIALSPIGFFGAQFTNLGPVAAPLWIAGLIWLATRRDRPELRVFPIAWVVAFGLFVLLHGKPYYLTSFAPLLFAAGAVAVSPLLQRASLRSTTAVALLIGGFVSLPIALPVLSPENLVAYQAAIGFGPSKIATENKAQSALPQHFADMFGWPEMAARVAEIYSALPADERAQAVFYGRNYGEASAVELRGKPLGGPPAISAHNAWYLWGARGFDGATVIALGEPDSAFAQRFSRVEVVGRTQAPYAMPYENTPILVLRAPKRPLGEIWGELKHFE